MELNSVTVKLIETILYIVDQIITQVCVYIYIYIYIYIKLFTLKTIFYQFIHGYTFRF